MKHLLYGKLKKGVTVLDDDYIVYKKLHNAVGQFVLPKGTRVMKVPNRQRKLRADVSICLLIIPCSYWSGKYETLYRKFARNLGMGGARYTVYTMGKLGRPDGFNTNIHEKCGQGFHFFCDERTAKNY